MEKLPYIAKIVEGYQTGNGNFFCREEGDSINAHHLDWPIFVSKEYAEMMRCLPIYGIVVTDYNSNFFNGESRPTCRTLSYERSHLEKIMIEEEEFNNEIDEAKKRTI